VFAYWLRPALLCAGLFSLVALMATPAQARQDIKIGVGFGMAFLPLYLCQELNLVEKQGKEAGLDIKANYRHLPDAGAMQDAVRSGAIDFGPYGVAALLIGWEKAKGTPQQTLAVAGLSNFPLVLLADRPAIKSIRDLKPTDRISMPSLGAPQMYVLEMASEKAFGPGQENRLRTQVVALPHAESVNALLSGSTEISAYFSSAPFTQLALASPKVHAILSSEDVMGPASLLVIGATRHTVETNRKISDVLAKAIDTAAEFIRSDPRKAAEIYLKYEPSKTLDVPMLAAVLRELQDDFGSPVHGVQAYADFMAKHGQLKNPPESWKEVVAPSLTKSPSS